jgi:hypothetical protein
MKFALWVIAAALPLGAQPKLLVNAQTDTRSAAGGLESAYKTLLTTQPQPAWIAYSVPAVRTSFMGCDYVRDGFTSPGVVHLEPPDHVVVLIRVEGNAVTRVRSLSPDCEIDAGGVPFHWLTEVQPAQSIALLLSLVPQREAIGTGELSAIAMHADPAADQALERFLAPDQPETMRTRVISWMVNLRGRHGFDVAKKVIAGDPDERVRERAVSAIANSKEPETLDLLISLARTEPNSRIRAQAVSGLGRKPGQKTVDTLTAVVENDQDMQVKRRAISALQQLPDAAGIPVLIQIAKHSTNLEIRKQAMSTLGNSRDPRATAFFEEVLKH